MTPIDWTADLETGIAVIDGQHRRIVDYINELQAISGSAEQSLINRVLNDLVDYTYSHFAFEEALMEEVGYDSLPIHRKTHEAFCARIGDLKHRAANGDTVVEELVELLRTWLLRHIMSDDQSYADLVREKLPRIEHRSGGSWINQTLRRFFGDS